MSTKNINTFIVRFKNEIAQWEIPLFRGCVISAVDNASVFYHNHLNDDELRYRYPLIQYKRINGKAAILCIGDGTEVIGEFFNHTDFMFHMGNRSIQMEVECMDAKRLSIHATDSLSRYLICKWLPLSSENYQTYKGLEGLVEQCSFLQKILIGNILSFCKGIDITMEEEIKCNITNISDTRLYTHKGVKMLGFDAEFKSNVTLPDYLGLGKGVGFGFGMIKKIK